nr:hypothetical protein [Rhizobium etli]
MAYQAEVPVNWCPAQGTVLANEEVRTAGMSREHGGGSQKQEERLIGPQWLDGARQRRRARQRYWEQPIAPKRPPSGSPLASAVSRHDCARF